MEKLIISILYLKTFYLYFNSKMEENQKPSHIIMHPFHKNPHIDRDHLFISFQETYIFYIILIIILIHKIIMLLIKNKLLLL